jgi:lipoprotein-anchoring transpeptidase ErfK/SrfK
MFRSRVELILVISIILLVLINILLSYDYKIFKSPDTITGIVESNLHLTKAERDNIFGTSPDENETDESDKLNPDMSLAEEKDSKTSKDSAEEIKDNNADSKPSIEDTEGNDIDFSNSEDFRIEVDLSRQVVLVYYKDALIKQMVCSGGEESSPTPIGEFTTFQKVHYQWVSKFNVGAYYWTRFYKDYLFHSVPFDENGEMIEEEYKKLGSPASHGCIRLKLEEAKWMYENLPLGVKVLIYE